MILTNPDRSPVRARPVTVVKARPLAGHGLEMVTAAMTAALTIALTAWIVTVLGEQATHVAFMLPY